MLLNTEKAKDSHFKYVALLLLIAILGFWQISFLKYSVTHDMINCWIPWRYYISQCFQNHIFPFWNPYQQLGYPIHADLQGPTWYLESILLSITTGQTNYTIHFLFVFYVFIAGIGMYFLSLCFHTKKNIAFLTAVCYMLGGFFAAHVQHFYAIIGAAWLPFILLNYYKMYTEKSYLRALYASVFMFFNLTGGNHTFSIILVYLFVLIFGYFVFTALKEKNKKDILHYLKINFLFVAATLLLASVVLVAYYQTAPYVSRLGGMIYKDAAVCPLSPQSLLSIILPFSTVNSVDFFNTDPSMCNIYTGVIMFVFVVIAFVSKKNSFEKLLFAFAIICLLASFGSYTPVHKLLFSYVPFMNLFRFPSYFSLFSIMIFLLLGGKQLAAFVEAPEINRKKVMIVTGIIFLLILSVVILAFIKNHNQHFFFFEKYDTVFEFLKASSLKQNIVLQGFIQLLFLGIFIFALIGPLKKYGLRITGILIILDLFVALQLNLAYVGFSPASPKELHEYILSLPQNFPIPSDNSIIENTEELGQKHGLYRNTSVFHKRISADVFNSYAFKNYAMLRDSMPQLYAAFLKNKLIYFSDHIYPASEINKIDSVLLTNKTIVLSNDDYKRIAGQINTNNNDTLIESIAITSYDPNNISIKAEASKPQLLTLLQSYYDGWEVLIDNNPVSIVVSNYLTMSVLFPKGKHEVTFQYKNPMIIKAGILSYTSFLIILSILSFVWIKKQKNYWAPVLIWFILVSAVMYYFLW